MPDFEGMDTRRCIYGIVDLRTGIIRCGATGRITSAEPPHCRTLLDRAREHFYAAKKVQDYWLELRDAVPKSVQAVHPQHTYALATTIALRGGSNYTILPLENLPWPDPVVVETFGQWQNFHHEYEGRWTRRLRTELPWGLNDKVSKQGQIAAHASRHPQFDEWFAKIELLLTVSENENLIRGQVPKRAPVCLEKSKIPRLKPLDGDPRVSFGQQQIMSTIYGWYKIIKTQKKDLGLYFTTRKFDTTAKDAYYLLYTDPGRTGLSNYYVQLLRCYLRDYLKNGRRTAKGGLQKRKGDPLLISMKCYHCLCKTRLISESGLCLKNIS